MNLPKKLCIDFGLIPKVLEAIFQAFLKFGQAIVDAVCPKISNFW
jgi:hypothetical protein